MSGYKSHGSKHGRDRERDGDGDRDRDGKHSHHHHHHHSRDRGESRGRDGSRDGRDRDHRGKHGDGSSREARGAPSTQDTPTKPPAPAPAPAKPPARGPVLGSSFLSSSVLEAAKAEAAKRKAAKAEAAKRKAAEAAAAAAAGGGSGDDEPGEVGAARKRPKHEPIVWQSPPKQDGGSAPDRPSSQQETLQERLQREAAEFKQQQQQHQDTSRPSSRQQRPSSRARSRSSSHSRSRSRSRVRGRSPPPSPNISRRQQRRRSPSSSDRSRSSSRDSREDGAAAARRRPRWQQEDEDAEQQQQLQKKKPVKSRWALDDEAGAAAAGGGGGEVEEGEAPGDGVGAAIDEELEELNRQERAALAAGDVDVDVSLGVGSDASERLAAEELVLQHNMLEESRKVEEYEKLNRISEGTYGIVFRARCKSTGKIYALKKLKMENCPDGFPQTSVREVNVLLSLHHPNIVNVTEVCVGGRDGIFMVMEYVEHDLKYIMELQKAKKAQQFSIGQIKCLMQQLLEGVAFLHHSWVVHRDLKTSNLLYSNTGQLKICDFGLARQYGDPLSPYTPMVVTLWYRSIERLLGDPTYDTALDMWSVGCIMAELLLGEPLFQGKGELDQIKKIFALLGTPTQESWPGWDELPDCKNLQFRPQESQLRSKFPTVFFGGSAPVLSDAGFDLLSRMLEMNPAKRITAQDALKHKWFQEAPRPVTPALMPSFQPRHQQGSAGDYRDKLHRPSPGAVGPAGFKL